MQKIRLTLASNNFFSPLRVKRPQKWSPGQSALLSDTVFGDIQIWLQKKEKTLFFLMDMSKCPQMSTISEKCQQRKIYQFSNFFLKITKLKISNSLHFDLKCHQMSSNVFLSYLKLNFIVYLDLFLQEKAFSQNRKKIPTSKFLK